MPSTLARSSGIYVLAVAGIFAVVARAQRAQMPTPEEIEHQNAVEAVRIINTAEYDYRTDHGRFGSWNDVYASGVVTNLLRTWPKVKDLSISSSDEIIPGYRLTLLVGGDGNAYSVSLHEMKSHGCGFSVFSDQAGLIYQGTVIDCPQITDDPLSRIQRP
ncbi:MAG TPA: hypothetical protein VEJ67_11155 [Candidatus Cybelea sp.]|nr:hypothetical protein [Candidatus Cybelea sp.]